MHVSTAPPAARGVTQLMAVGHDGLAGTGDGTHITIDAGSLAAAGVATWLLGAVFDHRGAQSFGGTLALGSLAAIAATHYLGSAVLERALQCKDLELRPASRPLPEPVGWY